MYYTCVFIKLLPSACTTRGRAACDIIERGLSTLLDDGKLHKIKTNFAWSKQNKSHVVCNYTYDIYHKKIFVCHASTRSHRLARSRVEPREQFALVFAWLNSITQIYSCRACTKLYQRGGGGRLRGRKPVNYVHYMLYVWYSCYQLAFRMYSRALQCWIITVAHTSKLKWQFNFALINHEITATAKCIYDAFSYTSKYLIHYSVTL